jgi:CheY-like chemotaxis protein
VLLVEDSEDDVFFFRQAMKAVQARFPLEVAVDGPQAVARLGGLSRQPPPGLVLLDLKLPRKSGLEILAWAREEAPLRDVRFVVLTSSSEAGDIRAAYDLGARHYVVKPMGMGPLRSLVAAIGATWAGADDALAPFAVRRPAAP